MKNCSRKSIPEMVPTNLLLEKGVRDVLQTKSQRQVAHQKKPLKSRAQVEKTVDRI
jgi:hypothetical protein